jgi:hypothetical protein
MKEINKLFLENNSHYPYVSLPNLVVTYLQGNTPCLDLLPLPTLQLEKVDYWGYLRIIGISILLVILILFKVTNLIPYGIIAFLFWLFINTIKPYKLTKQRNEVEKIKYIKELENVIAINNNRKSIKKSLGNSEKTEIYCQNKIYEILKTFKLPSLSNDNGKKGASEFFFLSFLLEYFGDKIKTYHVLSSDHNYIPDFIIQDEGICINIEIDEPYTLVKETRIPIHCSNDGKNEKRDNFFTSKNWCVIRFAEEQILLEPAECCKLIVDTIKLLTKVNIDTPEILIEKGYPQKIKRWNKNEALQFAKDKKRRAVYLQAEDVALKSEYYSPSSFNGNSFTFITNIDDWNDDLYLCMNLNNSKDSDKSILVEKALFPSLKRDSTIKVDFNDYKYRYEWIEDDYTSNRLVNL